MIDLILKAFFWILRFFKLSPEVWIQDLWDRIEQRRGKYPPENSKVVEFVCIDSAAENAQVLHIAGDFNEWLKADKAKIVPRRRYQLKKELVDGKWLWRIKVWLMPGHYNFKFVVNNNYWIHWKEDIDYQRGNDAPGGPNCLIVV